MKAKFKLTTISKNREDSQKENLSKTEMRLTNAGMAPGWVEDLDDCFNSCYNMATTFANLDFYTRNW